jgi:hypothetical protein
MRSAEVLLSLLIAPPKKMLDPARETLSAGNFRSAQAMV